MLAALVFGNDGMFLAGFACVDADHVLFPLGPDGLLVLPRALFPSIDGMVPRSTLTLAVLCAWLVTLIRCVLRLSAGP